MTSPNMKGLAGLVLGSGLLLLTACQTQPPNYRNAQQAAQARTALAAQYIQSGELDAAKRHLETALKDYPQSSEANMMMGILLQQEGSDINLREAEKYYRRSLSIDSKNAQARNNYGVYLTQLKRYPEAIRELEIAGASLGYEGRASALENLGRAAVLSGDAVRARKAFIQSLAADQERVIPYLELAQIFYDEGKLAEATDMYNRYVTRLGTAAQGSRSLYLGIMVARAQQDWSRADKLSTELQQRFPSSAESQRLQGTHSGN